MNMEGRKLALLISREAMNAGMSVFYILHKAHIDTSTFYRWRRGDGAPNPDSLKKLELCLSYINGIDSVFRMHTGGRDGN